MAITKPDLTADVLLPDLEDGEMATIASIEVRERKTRPPSQYTEGTLLDDMRGASKFIEDDPVLKKQLREVSGLGTAATRDSTIEGLKNDKYLEKSGKHIIATPKGVEFIKWLDGVMPQLTDVSVTARWEADLGLVAQNGGGAAFESGIAEMVRKLISTLKVAPPLRLAARTITKTTKESSYMSDQSPDQPRANKPTDKMMEYAKSIATRLKVPVPDEVMTNFDACKAFLDANKDAAMRPSEKQLNFANSIAERKGLTVPPEALANGKELSAWIDSHKG